ncbi:MucBP domain-containing protein [Lacticaseibacillus jixianensis]|uniref:MucBP domain-containing protein n=1 Tax=Lacticaseibacillus jixianensis TaxID=2486012 RepID=A0ABW4B8M2_9LACO
MDKLIREVKHRVKLYKSGKMWLAVALLSLGVLSVAVPVFPGIPLTQVVQAEALGPIVTDKDANGHYSVDPDLTDGDAVEVKDDNMAAYFTAVDRAGTQKPLNGRQVQLTTGYESRQVDNKWNYDAGTVLLLAKKQIDFTSDFALDTTMTITWKANMGDAGWVGGDGTALFFEPVSAADAIAEAKTGGDLGLAGNVSQDQIISYNVSTNAQGEVKSFPAGTASYPQNSWLVYQSNGDAYTPNEVPIQTGVAVPRQTNGTIAYTFKMSYDAQTRQLVTNVVDSADAVIKTWTFSVPADWSDKGYTMGISASTAASQAAYQANITKYSFAPAVTSLKITSTGLPAGTAGPSQDNVLGIAGNIVAFYPAGTTAPSSAPDGQPITKAYAVPEVAGYQLRNPQFFTVGTDKAANVVKLDYAQKAGGLNVSYVDGAGREIYPSTSKTGLVGDQYETDAPAISGYKNPQLKEGSAAATGTLTADPQYVTYVYEPEVKPAAPLTVNYVDDTGTQIQPPKVFPGNIDDPYAITTTPPEGYDFLRVTDGSAALSGKLTDQEQTITLVYGRKGQPADEATPSKLTVRYVDNTGAEIQDPVTKTGYVGNSYEVVPDKLDGYAFLRVGEDSAGLTGTFAKTDQVVTMVYDKVGQTPDEGVQSKLTVRYVDNTGAEIQDPMTKTGYVGNFYAVVPDKLDGYAYLRVADDSAGLTGSFAKADQVVTIVYDKVGQTPDEGVQSKLTVRYVDNTGAEIQDPVTKTGYVGNSYEVVPDKLDGYAYLRVADDSAGLTGSFAKTDQVVTMVYDNMGQTPDEGVQSKLTVRYVDNTGAEIQDPVTKTGYVGNSYAVTPDKLDGYTFLRVTGDSAGLTGTFGKTDQVVTMVYDKVGQTVNDGTQKSSLTIRYVDNTGAEIHAPVTKTGYVGNSYAVVPDKLDGYAYLRVADDSAGLTGSFAKADQVVTMVYDKAGQTVEDGTQKSSLTIRYVDNTGAEIHDPVTKTGYVGNSYTVVPDKLDSYAYLRVTDDSAGLTGTFMKTDQVVTMVYDKVGQTVDDGTQKSSLTIRYVDNTGAQIHAPVTKTGYVGNSYTVVPDKLDSYAYLRVADNSASLTGNFAKTDQVVTMVYDKMGQTPDEGAQSKLTVRYVDNTGAELHDPVTKTGFVGNSFAVVPAKIDGYAYLRLGEGSSASLGKFKNDNQTVTFVYDKIGQTPDETAQSKLSIRYLDNLGNEIHGPVVRGGYVGNSYAVTPDKLDGYAYLRVAEDSASLTGNFLKANQVVTMIYDKVGQTPDESAQSKLTVRYVDNTGAGIHDPMTKTGYVGNSFAVVPAKIDGYAYLRLGEGSSASSGTFNKENQTVTFVYDKVGQIPEEGTQGKLTVRYVDNIGAEIHDPVTKTGFVGNSFTVVPAKIDGYAYLRLGEGSVASSGTFNKENQTVTFVYDKVGQIPEEGTQGKLTVRYVDNTGAEIQNPVTKTGFVGNSYAVAPLGIDGYVYLRLAAGSAALRGSFITKDQILTMVYDKTGRTPAENVQSSLTIRYVDEAGYQIQNPVIKTGYVGNAYSVTPDQIAGYAPLGLADGSAPLAGQFKVPGQTVTLRYGRVGQVAEPIPGGVLTIHFIDQYGQMIRPDLIKAGMVGQGYAIGVQMPGYTFSGIGANSAPLIGHFGKAPIQVTLIYLRTEQTPVPAVGEQPGEPNRVPGLEPGPGTVPDVVPNGAETPNLPPISTLQADSQPAPSDTLRTIDIAVVDEGDPAVSEQRESSLSGITGGSSGFASLVGKAKPNTPQSLAVKAAPGSKQPAPAKRLPQTGNRAATGLTVASLSLLSLVGLLIGWKPRRRQ